VYVVAKRTGSFYGQQMLAGHIYKIEKRGLGGTDVRAGRAGNLVTIFTNDLCSNCGDTGSVAVLAARTGTFYGMTMLAGRVYTVASNNQDATAPGNGGPATRAALGSLSQLSLDAAGTSSSPTKAGPARSTPRSFPRRSGWWPPGTAPSTASRCWPGTSTRSPAAAG